MEECAVVTAETYVFNGVYADADAHVEWTISPPMLTNAPIAMPIDTKGDSNIMPTDA